MCGLIQARTARSEWPRAAVVQVRRAIAYGPSPAVLLDDTVERPEVNFEMDHNSVGRPVHRTI